MDDKTNDSLWAYLVAGAIAGLVVDVVLFPLDTIKTRLQSNDGFFKSGGFGGIYSGLLSCVVGSMPSSAAFFLSYEWMKAFLSTWQFPYYVNYILASSIGGVAACLIRVPFEVVKQRAQTSPDASIIGLFRQTLAAEGFRGLYRGFFNTISRDVPFSFIEFTLWEYFKTSWAGYQGTVILPWQSSMSGALAGAIAATITCPIDVAKTRVMLATGDSPYLRSGLLRNIWRIFHEEGLKGLFAGIAPRLIWISLGGAIFLGVYDKTKVTLIGTI